MVFNFFILCHLLIYILHFLPLPFDLLVFVRNISAIYLCLFHQLLPLFYTASGCLWVYPSYFLSFITSNLLPFSFQYVIILLCTGGGKCRLFVGFEVLLFK